MSFFRRWFEKKEKPLVGAPLTYSYVFTITEPYKLISIGPEGQCTKYSFKSTGGKNPCSNEPENNTMVILSTGADIIRPEVGKTYTVKIECIER